MRLIYVDEAGTSALEPVRVVASIIVDGDKHIDILNEEIKNLIENYVPNSLKDGFIFHTKELYNGGKNINRQTWPFQDRIDFIKSFICLPFVHDVPIAVGLCFKGLIDFDIDRMNYDKEMLIGIEQNVFEHGLAFSSCMIKSDSFITKYLNRKENAIVVAEDVTTNRQFLKYMALYRKNNLAFLSSEYLLPSKAEKILGLEPEPFHARIENILDVPHFVKKNDAPLLQLADACAFAFRRFLAKNSHGADLILAMLGEKSGTAFINDPAWFSGFSSGLFNTEKYFNDEQRETVLLNNKKLQDIYEAKKRQQDFALHQIRESLFSDN